VNFNLAPWRIHSRPRPLLACLLAVGGKDFALIMQTQDAPAEFLIKLWPWFEANRNRLIGAAVAAVVVLFIWYFITTQRAQKAIDAGQAYTTLQLNLPPNPTASQVADAYVKLADQYSGTPAGERAQLQAAAVLFEAERYPDAQALFQKFIDTNPGSTLVASARLGVAASLESQNKLDDAVAAYRAVISNNPDSTAALPAKFSLGRVLELQNHLTEAASYYKEVTRAQLAGMLGQEAAQRLAQLQAQLAATAPATPALSVPKF